MSPFSTDVQDQVVKLPGSQDATRKIVDLSLEYLEKLQAEKSDDVVLIADVASAYGRLGDIQGGANFVSANNLAASRKSWEKSRELGNRALQLAPRHPESLRAAAHAELALADAERPSRRAIALEGLVRARAAGRRRTIAEGRDESRCGRGEGEAARVAADDPDDREGIR